MLIASILIFIYWMILIIKYGYDKKAPIIYEDDLLEKINPVVAANILNNKDICITDFISTVLNLVRKKVLKLSSEKDIDSLNGGYKNIITLNPNSKDTKIDDVEKIILEIILDGRESVNLESRLLEISKTNNGKYYMQEIKKKLKIQLDELGSNTIKAPKYILTLNNIIFIISIVFISWSILTKVDSALLNILIGDASGFFNIGIIPVIIVIIIPGLLYLFAIILKTEIYIKMKINKVIYLITNKRLIIMVATNILFNTVLFIILTYIFKTNLIFEFLLYTIAQNIVLTDNVMAKHSKKAIKLYCQLNMIREKLVKYSLLEEKNIEDYALWEIYLIYSIAFMLNKKMINNILKNSSDKVYSTFISNIYSNEDLAIPDNIINMAKEYDQFLNSLSQNTRNRIK